MRHLQALLFDCDGVLAETERDGHRVAYNRAFEHNGLPIVWDSVEYADLVRVSGGKERIRHYLSGHPGLLPDLLSEEEWVLRLYREKTVIFGDMAMSGLLPLRPGVARLIEEARAARLPLFVCSTSHRESVRAILRKELGEEGIEAFTDFFCGDVVRRKKPAPDVYLAVLAQYGFDPGRCVVVEDSRNGLLAAKGAGMRCVITPSYYTRDEDFSEADAIADSLDDPVTLGELDRLAGMRQDREVAGYVYSVG